MIMDRDGNDHRTGRERRHRQQRGTRADDAFWSSKLSPVAPEPTSGSNRAASNRFPGWNAALSALDSLRRGENMESTGRSLQFAGSTFGQHICAFFNSIDEQHRVLRPFIKDGFDRGDKAYHLVDPEQREDHLRRLADAGINVQAAIGAGQLEVRPWQDGPFR